MLRKILCVACVLAAVPHVLAQTQINVTTQVIGKQRITTIDQVGPQQLVAGKQGEAPTVTALSARNWKCGIQFDDEMNRHWRRVYGPALTHHPTQLSGTIMRGSDGKLMFVTSGGTVFMRIEQM
jgi:hypothetical protein